jgi:hypothetical protein
MKINNKKQNSEPLWGFPSQEKSSPDTREGFGRRAKERQKSQPFQN